MLFRLSETDLLSLVEQDWKAAPQEDATEDLKTTVKIFANEIEFKNYKPNKRKRLNPE